MAPQRYERIAPSDIDDISSRHALRLDQTAIPSSPPPSFRSHASSRRSSTHLYATPPAETDVERSLDDAFGGPHDSDNEDEDADEESRRLVSRTGSEAQEPNRPGVIRAVTQFPAAESIVAGSDTTTRTYGGGSSTRDGVFANISAKPTRGEELEEKPPTYEQAAADATPPYWETTILTPGGFSSDDIFVDGLVVGSLFSFVWNALISMSFQLIGFLLTYLLHTTHAAKNGSRAGLGITLIQYGFTMRGAPLSSPTDSVIIADPSTGPADSVVGSVPADPNDHDFDPNKVIGDAGGAGGAAQGSMPTSAGDWFSYALMIVGWFILIRAASDFVRARRQEQLIRASPERGLPVPVVAEGEGERAV